MVLDLHADTLKACYLSSEGIITDAFRITKSDIPYLPDTGSVFCTINRKTIELSFLKSADKNYSIQLINSLGQTLSIFGNEPLFEKNNYVTFELQMPDQNIAEGIYYMVVDDGNKKQTCKVVYLE